MKRVLSVDWDFFFPESMNPDEWHLYDWGHREALFFIDHIWGTRAAGFVAAGKPLPGTSGDEVGFWNRFKFAPNAKLFISETHSHMQHTDVVDAVGYGAQILSFDAHHDCGYAAEKRDNTRDDFDCGNWFLPYKWHLDATMKVIYPAWKHDAMEKEPKPAVKVVREFDTGFSVKQPFDVVFICRSGAWAPPWIDPQFFELAAQCPVKDRKTLTMVDRKFDMKQVDDYVKATRAAHEAFEISRVTQAVESVKG